MLLIKRVLGQVELAGSRKDTARRPVNTSVRIDTERAGNETATKKKYEGEMEEIIVTSLLGSKPTEKQKIRHSCYTKFYVLLIARNIHKK